MIVEASYKNVYALLSKGYVMVDVWAPWCMPCKAVSREFERLAALDEASGVTWVKVNADECVSWRDEAGISGLPTVMLLKDGEVQGTLVGTAAMGMRKLLGLP